jgi:hypothetical protein
MKEASSPKKLLHVVIGTPDLDNCPICRAHSKAKVDQGVDDTLGPILIQELPLSEILRCPCPLCLQARQEAMED